jgi:acyl-CoA synthetase (AMP-forming)/AMP-acid ligase II
MTIGELLSRNARKFPEKAAIVAEPGGSFNYRGLNAGINRAASFLMESGLKKGDRIGVLLHDCPWLIELYFAAAGTGGIFCPCDNHLKAAELIKLINYSTPKFLVSHEDCDAPLGEAGEIVVRSEAMMKEFRGRRPAGFKKPKSVDFRKEPAKNSQGKVLKKGVLCVVRPRRGQLLRGRLNAANYAPAQTRSA